jgi:hypothetical protein
MARHGIGGSEAGWEVCGTELSGGGVWEFARGSRGPVGQVYVLCFARSRDFGLT